MRYLKKKVIIQSSVRLMAMRKYSRFFYVTDFFTFFWMLFPWPFNAIDTMKYKGNFTLVLFCWYADELTKLLSTDSRCRDVQFQASDKCANNFSTKSQQNNEPKSKRIRPSKKPLNYVMGIIYQFELIFIFFMLQ